jgi:hypothetical protein
MIRVSGEYGTGVGAGALLLGGLLLRLRDTHKPSLAARRCLAVSPRAAAADPALADDENAAQRREDAIRDLSLLVHDPVFPGPGGYFYSVANAELVLDAGDVGLDCAERDEQLGSDFLVGPSPGDTAGDVEFSS